MKRVFGFMPIALMYITIAILWYHLGMFIVFSPHNSKLIVHADTGYHLESVPEEEFVIKTIVPKTSNGNPIDAKCKYSATLIKDYENELIRGVEFVPIIDR